MAGWGEYGSAARMRDFVRSIASKVIQEERPKYKYAIVQSVNTSARLATVKYADDEDEVEVPFGIVAVPEGFGQVVRIEGTSDDRFISDVLTPFVP